VAIIQALYHRDKTGEGQFCDTSIINAGLLNTSYAVARPDGSGFERPHLDGMQLGFNALTRLYETQQGWLCLVVATEEQWDRLCVALAIEGLNNDPRFANAAARKINDTALADRLTMIFSHRPAAQWFKLLDSVGVPCEISDDQFTLQMHDDAEFKARGWVTSYPHPAVGKLDQIGLLFDLSETPGKVQGPPLLVGQHSREIMQSLGYSAADIDAACAQGYVLALA
jgi:crotonobetainyl-CoA:carnitine CoA-transferase CaiB-like acyl-CoA transferase